MLFEDVGARIAYGKQAEDRVTRIFFSLTPAFMLLLQDYLIKNTTLRSPLKNIMILR